MLYSVFSSGNTSGDGCIFGTGATAANGLSGDTLCCNIVSYHVSHRYIILYCMKVSHHMRRLLTCDLLR